MTVELFRKVTAFVVADFTVSREDRRFTFKILIFVMPAGGLGFGMIGAFRHADSALDYFWYPLAGILLGTVSSLMFAAFALSVVIGAIVFLFLRHYWRDKMTPQAVSRYDFTFDMSANWFGAAFFGLIVGSLPLIAFVLLQGAVLHKIPEISWRAEQIWGDGSEEDYVPMQ